MIYDKKPKMIIFDVGGTLFDDGKCDPAAGFEKLRLVSENPEAATCTELAEHWKEYLAEVSSIRSESGISLDIPLSAVIKYAAMNTGLIIDIPMAEQEEIFDRYNSSRTVIEGVPELLDELDSLGIRKAVISNNMMSGEGLTLAINRWIPDAEFEFVLTSADLLFTKPSEKIFAAAVKRAHLSPDDCWYCGDGKIPDIDGARNANIRPVLLDTKSETEFEIRKDDKGEYLAVSNWNALREYLCTLK